PRGAPSIAEAGREQSGKQLSRSREEDAMLVFVLKNLLLVCGCLLAASPCVVAVLNFRRRTAAKRRALTNLLSDPNILERYKDRFPARKYLGDAESIARD